MAGVNVLVVFSSRAERGEQLGLAAALGAINARANIRLRRVADDGAGDEDHGTPARQAYLERMRRDYIAPRPADASWADIVVLAAPGGSCEGIEAYCGSLQTGGAKADAIAAPLVVGAVDATLRRLYAAAACAGFLVAPAPAGGGDEMAAARAHGFRLTTLARRLKEPPASGRPGDGRETS
jgi:hypothetical protein